jgi:amidophosphoribosyltransferase
MRTFITQASDRKDLVAHVYDVTYGVIRSNKDTLVVLDDSIVRGNTLKESILGILDRLEPKKIVVVSSAPQIRYPDCYGIDMARLGNFVAFRAAIALLEENNQEPLIETVYEQARQQCNRPPEETENVVKQIYEPFTPQQISEKIAEIIKPKNLQADLKIIYQSIENLHRACPRHKGDWYFSGNYPTPGGNKVVNRSYIHYMEGKTQRAY